MDNTIDITMIDTTIDATMRSEQIQNYQQRLLNNMFTQKLEENEIQIKKWTDYKEGHKKVIEGLKIYPLSVSENCMVPIGKRALMKGKLVHTNEILVCLGDGYFAKYSASQAIALCNRRIAWADEILKNLEAERNLYETRQILSYENDVFGGNDRQDILEYWNENKLDEWKAQHRQCEKEYRQKLVQLREKENTDIRTEEDLFNRLDELELEEELEDEICRLEVEHKNFYGNDLNEGEVYDESEEDETSDFEEITTNMIEKELKRLKDIHMNKITDDTLNKSNPDIIKSVTSETTDEQSNFIADASQELETNCLPNLTGTKKKGRVSFDELFVKDQNNIKNETIFQEACSTRQDNVTCNSENYDDVIKIDFSHSSHISNIPESNNVEIQSPIDIYKMFNPKSILKRSPNDIPYQAVAPLTEDNTDTEDDNNVKHYAYDSVINDVQEKKVISPITNNVEKKNEKKTSIFKMQRAEIRK